MGKYTSKKNGMSHYPERLASRGASPVSVRMPFIDRFGRKYDSMESMKRGESRPPRAGDRD